MFGLAATGAGAARVTAGFVSAIERSFRGPGGTKIGGSLEHTAPLAPGSSGGPLVDAAGGLVAINTNRIGEGFYLARPADAALRERVDALGRGESVEPAASRRRDRAVARRPAAAPASVGLTERDGPPRPRRRGRQPGRSAGIREGDLLVEAAGKPLEPIRTSCPTILAETGLPIELKIVRGDEERTVSVGGTTDASGEA